MRRACFHGSCCSCVYLAFMAAAVYAACFFPRHHTFGASFLKVLVLYNKKYLTPSLNSMHDVVNISKQIVSGCIILIVSYGMICSSQRLFQASKDQLVHDRHTACYAEDRAFKAYCNWAACLLQVVWHAMKPTAITKSSRATQCAVTPVDYCTMWLINSCLV